MDFYIIYVLYIIVEFIKNFNTLELKKKFTFSISFHY